MSGRLRGEVRRVCAAFDGRDVAALEALAVEGGGEDGYLDAVMASAGDERTAIGGTWLLLRRFRKDAEGAAAEGARLAGLLDGAAHPDARLHVIQCLDRAVAGGGFDAHGRKLLAKALRADLDGGRPFVRAWALSVLARLAGETPSVRSWVGAALEEVEASGKASEKARVRRLRAEGALEWWDGGG